MSDLVEGPKLDVDALHRAIREGYARVAANPKKGFYFHTGRPLARMLEYPDEWLIDIPEPAIETFTGTGNPFSLGEIGPGQRVVDVGCGAGLDSLIAAKKVGPAGRVIGVDMTPSMLEKARQAAEEAGLTNVVEFREGYAEALPVPDGWADVVISNGVLSLIPDKATALEEMSRALKPGSCLQIGEILVQKRMTSLALPPAELEAMVVAAGFVGFEITWRKDVFSGAPQAGSAEKFGALGINFRARKAPTRRSFVCRPQQYPGLRSRP